MLAVVPAEHASEAGRVEFVLLQHLTAFADVTGSSRRSTFLPAA
jgi:hypothetical protein